MKKLCSLLGLKIGLALFCATVAATAAAYADDAKPAGLNPTDVKNALGMSIYLQSGYTYNPDASNAGPYGTGSQNDLRIFDHDADSFQLDLAELVFSRDTTTTSIGYRLKVSAGETAKWIHAYGLGTQPTGTANPESFDLTEAYISYTAPIGNGLRFDIGKMVTFVGAEVIEALDNPNYSRSFLFNYAEPLTHTGVKASYVFNDYVNSALFLVNGWDNATDNNSGKTVGVSINLADGDPFSASINYLQGPEETNDNRDNRKLLDLVATIKPLKPLTIILNYDNGSDQNAPLPSGTSGGASWSGFSGIAKYDINDTFSISFRGETFDDNDGFRTGTAQRLTEYTLTPEIRLAGGFTIRPEYRHDESNHESFDNNTKKNQNTYAIAAMYRW
jgi:Putative beta-barrel porin-2, OmpL-like. bbp2